MATYTAGDIVLILGQQLHDVGQDIWTEALLLNYISEAQNQIALLRPDAIAAIESFVLEQSAKQSIPAGGVRLLDCIRNLGPGGTTPGRHIKKVSRDEIDGYIPDWTSAQTATEITHYIFELETPRVFWVYPTPSIATLTVELSYAKAPATVSTTSDIIGLDNIYISPIIEWVLYRCLSMQAKGGNPSFALQHMSAFYTALGSKNQTDQALAQVTK